MSKLCDQVDEIISTDTLNNKNVLPDGTKDIITSHDYNMGKEITDITRTCGGQIRGVADLIKKSVSHLKIFGDKAISITISPISKALGSIIIKFPPVKKVLNGIKAAKVIIASIGALISVRVIARFDYWALIISESIPQLPIDTKAVLSGIRRLRIEQKDMTVCIVKSNEILNLVMDEENSDRRKTKGID